MTVFCNSVQVVDILLDEDEDKDNKVEEVADDVTDTVFLPVKSKTIDKSKKSKKSKSEHPKDITTNTYVFVEDLIKRVR